MYWETVILAISFVVLAFDIAWQFWVAGMYAPKKAEKLIMNNPRFKRLEQLVVTLESKSNISMAADPARSSDIEKLSREIPLLISDVTELSNKLDLEAPDMRKELTVIEERLRGAINGAIGNLSSQYYEETGMTDEDKKENKELVKLATNTMAQEQQIDFYFHILEPMVGPERAEKLSAGLVRAPTWLKGIVKKKIGTIIKEYGG